MISVNSEKEDVNFFALGLGRAASLDTLSAVAKYGKGAWEYALDLKNLDDMIFSIIQKLTIIPRSLKISDSVIIKDISSILSNGHLNINNQEMIQFSPHSDAGNIYGNCYSTIYLISEHYPEEIKYTMDKIDKSVFVSPLNIVAPEKNQILCQKFAKAINEQLELSIQDSIVKIKDMSSLFEQTPSDTVLKSCKDKILAEKTVLDSYKKQLDWSVTNNVLCSSTAFLVEHNLPKLDEWKTKHSQDVLDEKIADQIVSSFKFNPTSPVFPRSISGCPHSIVLNSGTFCRGKSVVNSTPPVPCIKPSVSPNDSNQSENTTISELSLRETSLFNDSLIFSELMRLLNRNDYSETKILDEFKRLLKLKEKIKFTEEKFDAAIEILKSKENYNLKLFLIELIIKYLNNGPKLKGCQEFILNKKKESMKNSL